MSACAPLNSTVRRHVSARIDPNVAKELQTATQALEPHGFRITAIEGGGAMFWAEFRSAQAAFRIVKDRGFWHIDGEGILKGSPSRKSQSAAVTDAIAWITGVTPNTSFERTREG